MYRFIVEFSFEYFLHVLLSPITLHHSTPHSPHTNPEPRPSHPGLDSSHPVQQPPSVPRPGERLEEKKEPELPQQPAENRRRQNYEGRHYHKAQDDEGGAAVVVEVAADSCRGVEDLEGQSKKSPGL